MHGCMGACMFVFSPRAVEESLNGNWFNTRLCMGAWMSGCMGVWVFGGCMSACVCMCVCILFPSLYVCVCV